MNLSQHGLGIGKLENHVEHGSVGGVNSMFGKLLDGIDSRLGCMNTRFQSRFNRIDGNMGSQRQETLQLIMFLVGTCIIGVLYGVSPSSSLIILTYSIGQL